MKTEIRALANKAGMIRKECLEMTIRMGSGHLTSALSCADIIAVLYYSVLNLDPNNPDMNDRDRFILSKNHASMALYPVLADFGYIREEELLTAMNKGSRLGSHSSIDVPGIEYSGGALGIGFGVAAGMAYKAKMDHDKWSVFALLGDGECYEGSIWETAMFAGHNRLGKLTAIIDRNGLSATEFTENSLTLDPLDEKWRSFKWDVCEVDGHDVAALKDVLTGARDRQSDKPLCVIANTVKGDGIDFMCNEPFLHGMAPARDNTDKARDALTKSIESRRGVK